MWRTPCLKPADGHAQTISVERLGAQRELIRSTSDLYCDDAFHVMSVKCRLSFPRFYKSNEREEVRGKERESVYVRVLNSLKINEYEMFYYAAQMPS
ncbi:hypothetical protein KIN20_024715 [Parelaphostrongylus tenuis]|uniref:Uncharacterized protein n=1 Tax=Parelaphostrongylus tenuis TaxID=148309 RepID=A0AAD5MYM2_PARTN|nr:hypothetical protein KIN20_024715 [Parelaphostrongylus tenuis]